MTTSFMSVISGTRLYMFFGVFNHEPNSELKPVIEHFKSFIGKDERRRFNLKCHSAIKLINKQILKIGFYKKDHDSNVHSGPDNSSHCNHRINKVSVINLTKRA